MNYALITGASKGIGKALTEELASRGFGVLLVARSEEMLDKLSMDISKKYNVPAHSLALDLSQSQASVSILNWCTQGNYSVSLLINNAGYGLWGSFRKLGIKDQLNMMQLNMAAMVDLTYCMIPLLIKNGPAYILNVASTTAYQPVPTLTVYAATKSFVVSFSHGLRYEMRNSQISVNWLSPGSTDTDFMDRAGMEAMKQTAKKFNMSPEKVAQIAVDQLFKKKGEIIPGRLNWWSSKLANILPSELSTKIAADIYEKHLPT